MLLDRSNEILLPGYLPFETGYRRINRVLMEIASLHRLHGVKGEMLEWWMRQISSDDWERRQHPYGTKLVEWLEKPAANSYVGATFIVESTAVKGRRWRVSYHDAAELLDTERFEEGNISFATSARLGSVTAPHWAGKFVQVARDTEFGCEVRFRYWFGDTGRKDESPDAEVIALVTDDDFATRILKYDLDGMENLASFLPALYAGRQS